MKLDQGEYTSQGLIDYLNSNFKKLSGKKFNHSDIAQYCIRGYLPYRYGGQLLTDKKESGVKIITLIIKDENKTK